MDGRRLHGVSVIAIASGLVFCHASRPPGPAAPPAASVAEKAAPPAPIVDAGAPAAPADAPARHEVDERWRAIDAVVEAAIEAGKTPGCVVVVGRHDEVLFERAYGWRSLVPERTPMTLDTVFDLASLTKPLATATSIMILVDRGQVERVGGASKL